MNNVIKASKCIFKSRILSLRYLKYVNTLFGSLLNQNIENLQIMSAKYTVLMLSVRQTSVRRPLAGRHCTKIKICDKDVWLISRYCS